MGFFNSLATFLDRILNTLAVIIIIVLNVVEISHPYNNLSTGTISDRRPTYITPANSAFIIWTIIFIFLALFAVYQWIPKEASRRRARSIAAPLFFNALVHGAWLFAWAYESLIAAEVLMLLILLSLIIIYFQLGHLWPEASFLDWFFLHVPFSLYLGWISAAALLNTYIVATSWNGQGLDGGPDGYNAKAGIAGLIVIGAVGYVVTTILGRRDWVYGLVLVWVVSWTAVQNLPLSTLIGATAIGTAGAIFGFSLVAFTRKVEHWLFMRGEGHYSLWDSRRVTNSRKAEEDVQHAV